MQFVGRYYTEHSKKLKFDKNSIMKKTVKPNEDLSAKKNIFEFFTESLGWLQIVFSPLLLSAFLGFIIYASNPSMFRLILSIVITLIGLIIGIIWATHIWKTRGTVDFVSRISASPELDNLDLPK